MFDLIKKLQREGFQMPEKAAATLKARESIPDYQDGKAAALTDLEKALAGGRPGDTLKAALSYASFGINGDQFSNPYVEATEQAASITFHLIKEQIDGPAWQFIAGKFNEAGAKLKELAAVVNIDAAPEIVLNLSEPEQTAWRDALPVVDDLEKYAGLIVSHLKTFRQKRFNASHPESWLGLFCNPGGAHKRLLVESFKDSYEPPAPGRERLMATAKIKSRTGKYGRILRLGASLEVAKTAGGWKPWTLPALVYKGKHPTTGQALYYDPLTAADAKKIAEIEESKAGYHASAGPTSLDLDITAPENADLRAAQETFAGEAKAEADEAAKQGLHPGEQVGLDHFKQAITHDGHGNKMVEDE